MIYKLCETILLMCAVQLCQRSSILLNNIVHRKEKITVTRLAGYNKLNNSYKVLLRVRRDLSKTNPNTISTTQKLDLVLILSKLLCCCCCSKSKGPKPVSSSFFLYSFI